MSKAQVGIKMEAELKEEVDNHCLLNGITKTEFWVKAARAVLDEEVVDPDAPVDPEADTTVIPAPKRDLGIVGCIFPA